MRVLRTRCANRRSRCGGKAVSCAWDLCGGVFQNRLLTEQAEALLTAAGFEVLIPQRLPVNDAAISFGQLIETIAAEESVP